MGFELKTVTIEKDDTVNFILGQSHFIKTVEDLYEAMVNSVPEAKFGLAFCEASVNRLVRCAGTDDGLIETGQEERVGNRCGAFIHHYDERLLSHQCAQCNQGGARSLLHILRHCQSHNRGSG